MATDKPRFSVTFTEESFEKIQKYQKQNNITTQSKAVARLVEMAINDIESCNGAISSLEEKEIVLVELSCQEKIHIKKYRSLDDYGKEAVENVLDVEYRRCKEDNKARNDKLFRENREQIEAAVESTPEVVYFTIPRQLYTVGAGGGQYNDYQETENQLLIKEPPRGTSYIAPVSGDSMEPTYHDGDLLFIRATVDIKPGQIGVFFMDGQQWVKECGDGELISHNPAYDPEPFTEDVRCQGIVLGVCDESYLGK